MNFFDLGIFEFAVMLEHYHLIRNFLSLLVLLPHQWQLVDFTWYMSKVSLSRLVFWLNYMRISILLTQWRSWTSLSLMSSQKLVFNHLSQVCLVSLVNISISWFGLIFIIGIKGIFITLYYTFLMHLLI